MNRFRVGLMMLGAMALAGNAAAVETPLAHTPHKDLFFVSYKQLPLQTAMPSGDYKLPEFEKKGALYGVLELADSKQLVVLERPEKARFYTRLYLDRDADGDLAEEKPIEGQTQVMDDNYANVEFQDIDLELSAEGKKLPCRLQLSVYAYQFGKLEKTLEGNGDLQRVLQANVRGSSTWRATCELGGRNVMIDFVDRNLDGRFAALSKLNPDEGMGERGTYNVESDMVYVTEPGARPDYYDGMPLTDVMVIGDQAFTMKADPLAGKLALEPIDQGLAGVSLPGAVKQLTLFDTAKQRSVSILNPKEPTKAPTGEYRMISYMLMAKDEQGDLWRLTAAGSSKSPAIAIVPDTTSVIALGEPFRPMVEKPMPMDKDSARLQFVVLGKSDEVVREVSHVSGNATKIARSKRGGDRPKEPSYRIVKADGEKVASGDFEYG